MGLVSHAEWRAWGKRDPLWGVASWPGRERGGQNPWTDDEFYALGEDWHDFDAAWLSSVGYKPGTVIEISCGAGRITRKLADCFDQVIAADVSADVIGYASRRIEAANVQWTLSEGDLLSAADDSADGVFSCHVLQHFPSNAAQLHTFKEVRRVLRPGRSDRDQWMKINGPPHMRSPPIASA